MPLKNKVLDQKVTKTRLCETVFISVFNIAMINRNFNEIIE